MAEVAQRHVLSGRRGRSRFPAPPIKIQHENHRRRSEPSMPIKEGRLLALLGSAKSLGHGTNPVMYRDYLNIF